MADAGQRWVIELESYPDDTRPVARRVARLLKFAARSCGLKCLMVRDPTADAGQDTGCAGSIADAGQPEHSDV